MLVILISAFIWRTNEHNNANYIECYENEPCEISFQTEIYQLIRNKSDILLHGEQNNNINIYVKNNPTAMRYSKNGWQIETKHKNLEIIFEDLNQSEERLTVFVR